MTIVLVWLKENWQGAAVGLVIGFLVCRVVTPDAAPVVTGETVSGAATKVSGTATARSSGKVEVPGRPATPCPPNQVCPECPTISVSLDCEAAIAGALASNLSSSAKVALASSVPWSLDIGGGKVLLNGEAWNAELGLSYGKLRGAVGYATDGSLRVGASYKILGN